MLDFSTLRIIERVIDTSKDRFVLLIICCVSLFGFIFLKKINNNYRNDFLNTVSCICVILLLFSVSCFFVIFFNEYEYEVQVEVIPNKQVSREIVNLSDNFSVVGNKIYFIKRYSSFNFKTNKSSLENDIKSSFNNIVDEAWVAQRIVN